MVGSLEEGIREKQITFLITPNLQRDPTDEISWNSEWVPNLIWLSKH